MAYEGPHPLPIPSGGTGDASFTAYSLVCGGTTSTSSLQNVSGVGTSGQVLTSNGASALPTWASPATSGTVTSVSVVSANGLAGTVATATTTPAITISTTATGVLSGNGTSISGSAVTQYDVLVGGASNAISSVGPGTSGQILQSGGNAANPAYSTSTYPSTNAINTLLYASSANVMAALATANDGVLVTSNTGVPSWLANSGTAGWVLTANTGAPPSWQAASGGSGITTIDGDSGSISGSTVTIKAGVSALNCGATVEFVNSSTTSTLNVSDANFNTIIGALSGKTGMSGVGNSCVGYQSLQAITSGSSNTSVGYISGQSITTGIGNTAIGEDAMPALTTGNSNIAIGTQALTNLVSGNSNIVIGLGNAYTTSETSNILIGNCPGTVGESLVTRIGYGAANGSQITKCFIDGIQGVSVSNLNMVTINTSTGQLGSQAFTIPALTITTVNHAASPYTVLAADQFLAVTVAGGVVTVKLPNAPTTGRVIYIKDSTGAAATSNISVTTVGGTVTIDGQTTYTMATNYQSLSVVFDGTNYEVF